MTKGDKKSFMRALTAGLIALGLLLALDQFTKYLAYRDLRAGGPFVIWPGVFELRYLQNVGAAFGIFQNRQWVFILFAVVVTLAAGGCFIRLSAPLGQTAPKGSGEHKSRKAVPLQVVCILLMAGALGNMADRVLHRYVIDFLYISLIDFPIFNVADIYVCAGTALFLFLTLFYYRDSDLERLLKRR